MLFAGRQCEHETTLAIAIDRFSADAPGHLAQIFLPGCQQAHIWAAEIQPDTDGLAFANNDVRPHFSRWLERAKRNYLRHHGDKQHAFFVRGGGNGTQITHPAKHVG